MTTADTRKKLLASYLLNRMAGDRAAMNFANFAQQAALDLRAPLPSSEDSSIVEPPVFSEDQSRPMLDDFTLRAARHVSRRDPGAAAPQEVVPVEPRKGSWSGYNQLGIEVPFAPNANNEQTVLKLDEWGMPLDWTVSFGIATPTGVEGGGFDVTALLRFGSGGATQEVEIDWLAGSAITLPMNAVNVIARYNFADLESPPEAPEDLRLRVTLSRMPCINARPTRSYWFPTGMGADRVLIIPPFAKSLLIFTPEIQNPPTFYTDFLIRFITSTDGTGTTVANYRNTQFLSYIQDATLDSYLGAPMPVSIPPFARALQLRTFPGDADAPTTPIGFQFLIGL